MKSFARTMGVKSIIKHEGLRLKPYRCTANKLTIGYGRNIEDMGITEKEAQMLLQVDTDRCVRDLLHNVKDFGNVHPVIQAVLLDMIFALGLTRFLKFKKMLSALDENNIAKFIAEMLDSDFARKQPGRITELTEMVQEIESLKDSDE